jgi:integrase
MVVDFTERLLDDGRSRAMVRKALTSLKTLISHTQATGRVAQNVAREIKFRTDGRHDAEVEIPSKNELRTMLDKVSGRWRPFVVTAIFTGMRVSELRGLTWGNVDLAEKVLRVRQRADAWGTLGSPKSRAGRRDIPLAPMIVNALKEWKLACPASDLDLVFPNGQGNVESYANIRTRGFVPLLETCGLTVHAGDTDDGEPILKPRYGFHVLRHAAASLFIEQGWSPKRVQKILGHASIAMTMDTYGHLFHDPEGDQDAMAQVEARLLG